MDTRRFEQKLVMLLNEPAFLKRHLQRDTSDKNDPIKTIFPPVAELERFQHLELARQGAQRDLELDGEVVKLISRFENRMKENMWHDKGLELKKASCLGKLKMDYVEEQMSEHLEELEGLIHDHGHYSGIIQKQRQFVQKMIRTTEIKKALTIQNSILHKQNEELKKQQEEVDRQLVSKRKK